MSMYSVNAGYSEAAMVEVEDEIDTAGIMDE